MEQKDIDRLLICRAAVDKQREFNKALVADNTVTVPAWKINIADPTA